jgi:hypothetical protein
MPPMTKRAFFQTLLQVGLVALALGAAVPVLAKTARKSVLPFQTSSYEAALRVAKERDLPLFVENWAPW